MILFLILITFLPDYILKILGENCCPSLLGRKGLISFLWPNREIPNSTLYKRYNYAQWIFFCLFLKLIFPLQLTIFLCPEVSVYLCIQGSRWSKVTWWFFPQKDPSCSGKGLSMYPWTICCYRWSQTASYSPSFGSVKQQMGTIKYN